ncbi:MAG: family 78 glycoside hydrolase catalytic domain [Clostridia bacterium]|nr:family 78 glycoside hydrolase catalytic domain [Clostridia bacterium]
MLKDAKWIKAPCDIDDGCFIFSRDFTFDKKVEKATLYVTALGLYRAYLNGKELNLSLFTPGFTSYDKRIQYQEYDVTESIGKNNSLLIEAAEGWAVGNMTILPGKKHRYSDHIKVIYSLEITFSDGSRECINSGCETTVTTSNVISSSIYDGETVDMTAEIKPLGNAVPTEYETKLVPDEGERVSEHEVFYPSELIITPKGERVIDFGQNLAGYVEISVSGKRGDRITLSHAEILDPEGNFYTDNLRSAKAVNAYVLAGKDKEVFKPKYSWQGFRYIRLDEYPFEEVDLSCFKAVAVYSDIRRISDFSCGNEKINQLYRNIIWGQKGNFLDIPTDCPQRDERMGWTGDAQIFVRTAAINFDVERFFKKWLSDLAENQYEDGSVPLFVPDCRLAFPKEKVSSAWGDAATICPWEIFMAYGNKEILERQFDSMKKWVDYITKTTEKEFLWFGGKQMGDWLALDTEESKISNNPVSGRTPREFIASAFYAKSTEILVNSGKILGKDMSEYEALYKNIVKAFKETFMKDGFPVEDTQTAYAMALYFNLCDDKKKVAAELSRMVRANGNRLTTGFVGTPYLLHALSENGEAETAYDLLFQEGFPSWLYSVNRGATTMWEHWDGVKEDGTFWDKVMNSYNHYAYGAVGDWIFGAAAGIRSLPDGAGYKHIEIKPCTDKRMGYVKYTMETRMGKLSSHWYYDLEGNVHFEFEIPEKSTADIILPDGRNYSVNGGKYSFICK